MANFKDLLIDRLRLPILHLGTIMFTQRKEQFGFQIAIKKNALGLWQKDRENNYIFQYTYYIYAPPVEAVVFQGGGGRTMPYTAFLEKIENKRDIIKQFGGSSAGAFFAVLAAIPFRPGEIKQALASIEISKDILPQAKWAKLYKILLSPLYLISKPLTLSAQFFEKRSQQKKGFIAKILLLFFYVLRTIGLLTHPVIFVAIYNILMKGGLFRGEVFQTQLRDTIHAKTQLALQRFLCGTSKNNREEIKQRILSIPNLVKHIKEDNGLVDITLATKDISYRHFYELSRIANSGFKSVFTLAVLDDGPNDKKLKVYNHINWSDVPLHAGVRHSISIPYLYTKTYMDGKTMIDGSCMDNFPLKHVCLENQSTSDYLQSYFRGEYQQDLRILGVCSEDKKGLLSLYTTKKQLPHWQCALQKNVVKWFTGIDIISHHETVQQYVRDQYALRVLQLFDHDIKVMDFMVDREKQEEVIEEEKKRIDEFFAIHNEDELIHVQNFEYTHPTCMPLEFQQKCLHFLKTTTTPSNKIFVHLPPDINPSILRNQIINQLETHLKAKPRVVNTLTVLEETSSLTTHLDIHPECTIKMNMGP